MRKGGRRFVVVHDYENPAMQIAVRNKVLELYDNDPGRMFLLVGGWHLPKPGPGYLLSDSTYEYLVNTGIPKELLVTQRTLFSEIKYVPPRHTFDELRLIPFFLQKLGYPETTEFDAVCIKFMSPGSTINLLSEQS